MLPCALVADRDAADEALLELAGAGIEGIAIPPGRRYHGIAGAIWEIRVPASQAARARVLLS